VRLLTVARLVEIKGHEFALRAVARVHATQNIRYDIVGDGPLRSRLEGLVAELGLQDAVILHGARDGAFIEDLLAAAHIGILASVNIEGDAEGQGLFLQEAQACGLPVLATRHGALPEGLVPDKSGYLVPERDVESLAAQLTQLIEHSERWPEFGRAGRAFVEKHFEIHALTHRLVELYHSVRTAFKTANSR
jgi:colanic acid/amylovoran biosynthesis glycosyltransferase